MIMHFGYMNESTHRIGDPKGQPHPIAFQKDRGRPRQDGPLAVQMNETAGDRHFVPCQRLGKAATIET